MCSSAKCCFFSREYASRNTDLEGASVSSIFFVGGVFRFTKVMFYNEDKEPREEAFCGFQTVE